MDSWCSLLSPHSITPFHHWLVSIAITGSVSHRRLFPPSDRRLFFYPLAPAAPPSLASCCILLCLRVTCVCGVAWRARVRACVRVLLDAFPFAGRVGHD